MKFNYFIQKNNEENYIFNGHILNNIVNYKTKKKRQISICYILLISSEKNSIKIFNKKNVYDQITIDLKYELYYLNYIF